MNAQAEKKLEEKREEFARDFYRLWDDAGFGKDDTESSYPQGMPWLSGAEHDLDDVRGYFDLVKEEIAKIKKGEIE